MNNWLTHSITIGAIGVISFGLIQFNVASKEDKHSSGVVSSPKSPIKKLAVTQQNIGPFLPVDNRKPTSSRPVHQTEDGAVYSDFAMNPFEVKISNERHGWTDLNARDAHLVDQLAHNDFERKRLLDENLWTPKRELVYRNETLAQLAAKAEKSGDSISEVILPGFSGDEYKVTVVQFESEIDEDGVAEGTLKGHLTNDPDSNVLVTYYGQRETGIISSPNLEQDISYDPREDGQVMVKSVDLEALAFALQGFSCNAIYGAHEVGEANPDL